MLQVDTILRAIISKQAEYAELALSRPAGHDSFDYGKACGRHAAYHEVHKLIQELLEKNAKEEEIDND